ncbi:MAG: c-type cytochrome, partial [Terriglobia bacterium]
MITRMSGTAALSGLVALMLLAAASPVAAQQSGAEIWARTCGNCHRAQPPNKYHADFWRAVMGHMALNARLTKEEEQAVTEWLMATARPISMEPGVKEDELTLLASADAAYLPIPGPERGAELFGKQCAPCHGAEGKGDGPAAVALTPRPSDLTAQEVRQLTDDELLESLTKGKGAMPGFAAVLSPEELAAVLEFVRKLSVSEK